jgi:hypothetical protein
MKRDIYKYGDKECVDELVRRFWHEGYLTVKRRYGKYLPEPEPIGDIKVDAIGKSNNKYVIGITLGEEDFSDPNLLRKIKFLSSRRAKYSKTRIALFIGVPRDYLNALKGMLKQLDEETRRNIKLVPLKEQNTLFN